MKKLHLLYLIFLHIAPAFGQGSTLIYGGDEYQIVPPPPPRPCESYNNMEECTKSRDVYCAWVDAKPPLQISELFVNYCTTNSDDKSYATLKQGDEIIKLDKYDSCLEDVKRRYDGKICDGGKYMITNIRVNNFGSHQYTIGCVKSSVCVDGYDAYKFWG